MLLFGISFTQSETNGCTPGKCADNTDCVIDSDCSVGNCCGTCYWPWGEPNNTDNCDACKAYGGVCYSGEESADGITNIEGRWHLVGYEDNVMYQFEDNYRYSIYSLDGTFGGLEDAGGSPNPYTIVEDIITIDLFFGTIVNYQMNFICEGEVVEFRNIDYGTIHSTHFREGYDYQNSPCNDIILDECEAGFVEINSLCYHEGDIEVIQAMIDSSYQSNIDLDCQDGDLYCGSPNPFMDSLDNWGWINFDGISIEMPGNANGMVEPLELGIQTWENGRLTSFMCGAYIYCQLSGGITHMISNLTEIEVLRLELNYFDGEIPESICDLNNVNFNDYLSFDFSYNQLCPPYPVCIPDDAVQYMDTSGCFLNGDVNYDNSIDILDVVMLVNNILSPSNTELAAADINDDDLINVLDVVALVNIILNI